MQTVPVTRAIAEYSCARSETSAFSGLAAGGNGIVPCEGGVDASGFWDVFKNVVKTVGPPLIGML
jgi:hypothetical protein